MREKKCLEEQHNATHEGHHWWFEQHSSQAGSCGMR